jgi:mono/diheme cytochrome c family protein
MRKLITALALPAVLGLALFWFLTAPQPLIAADVPQHIPDVANGLRFYNASGCHSCHKAPQGFASAAADLPVGGAALKTPVGTFYPANLTPDTETGIGAWSDIDFVNALQKGISKSGAHLIPALPYTSYAKMRTEDVLDIKAYLLTLPPVKNVTQPHDVLALPVVRRGIGLWKLIAFNENMPVDDPKQTPSWNMGQYLVNGAGHCNECHTPRDLFMAMDMSRYLAGGPHPEGKGNVPSLRDLLGRARYRDAGDLASAFEFGEIMGYDKMSSGGMGAVQTNLSKLPPADRQAIADYLVTLK